MSAVELTQHPGAYSTKSYKDWFTNICNQKYLELAHFTFNQYSLVG
jgi:hypothetical protein